MSATQISQPTTDVGRYIELDMKVDGAEHDAIFARWEFGRELLGERVGKQLPKGRLDEVAAAVGKSRREIGYRLQFAETFPGEEEVRNALQSCESWRAVVESLAVSTRQPATDAGDEWYTPAVYADAARVVLGAIALDPASTPEANGQVGAERIYTAAEDGLAQEWSGTVFLHAPIGEEASFARKLIEGYESRAIDAAILLAPARLDAGWFAPLYDHVICFADHRLKLWSPGREPQKSGIVAFAYLGNADDLFAQEFSAFGPVMKRVG